MRPMLGAHDDISSSIDVYIKYQQPNLADPFQSNTDLCYYCPKFGRVMSKHILIIINTTALLWSCAAIAQQKVAPTVATNVPLYSKTGMVKLAPSALNSNNYQTKVKQKNSIQKLSHRFKQRQLKNTTHMRVKVAVKPTANSCFNDPYYSYSGKKLNYPYHLYSTKRNHVMHRMLAIQKCMEKRYQATFGRKPYLWGHSNDTFKSHRPNYHDGTVKISAKWW